MASLSFSLIFTTINPIESTSIVSRAKRRLFFAPSLHFNMYEDDGFLLEFACKTGNFPLVKFIVDNFYSESNFFKAFITTAAFRRACQNGHLPVAQYLLAVKPTINVHAHQEYAFRTACRNGHLNVAEWLWIVRPDIDFTAANYGAFRAACKNGKLVTAKWLYHVLENTITSHDDNQNKNPLTAVNFDAFASACENGHLYVAKWLHKLMKRKKLLDKLSIEKIKHIFCLTCKGGHLYTAKWLLDNVIPKTWNESKEIYIAFCCACEGGHIKTAKWLYWIFSMDVMDNKQCDIDCINEAFSLSCKNGHLKIAKWLYKMCPCININLKIGDGKTCLHLICQKGYLHILKWFARINPNLNFGKYNGLYFIVACENGHLNVAQMLLQSCPTIDVTNRKDLSFRLACLNGHIKVAKWLESLYPNIYTVLPITHEMMHRGIRAIPHKIIQRLPISEIVEVEKELHDCPICSETPCQIITNCMHSFCIDCMTTWWNASEQPNSHKCPYCRETITEFKQFANQIKQNM